MVTFDSLQLLKNLWPSKKQQECKTAKKGIHNPPPPPDSIIPILHFLAFPAKITL